MGTNIMKCPVPNLSIYQASFIHNCFNHIKENILTKGKFCKKKKTTYIKTFSKVINLKIDYSETTLKSLFV